MPRINGLALASTALGGLLVWSGFIGETVADTLSGILKGTPPKTDTQPISLATGGSGSTSGGTAAAGTTDSNIANDALQYVGDGYAYGGPSTPNQWDCSSFVSYVLGHDCGFGIPGGTWASETDSGAEHGPSTLSYLAWTSGAPLVGHSASDAQPGDLCVWQSHMGICTIAGTQMVSAQDEALGVGTSNISMPGELLFVMRLAATAAVANTGTDPVNKLEGNG